MPKKSTKTKPVETPRETRFPVTTSQMNDIEKRFTYHSPQLDQIERYAAIRAKVKELAYLVAQTVPTGREQSRALTALEDVSFNANAGIARNG